MTGRHYDTVIVGAGSAGAVLAARLSEDPARAVCLVEAGPDYHRVDQLPARIRGFDFTDRPYAGARIPSHEWQYLARATDRSPEIPVPRGRVIGGSSSINGAVFLRALRSDLDSWAAGGNTDWSFERCLPYYQKLETDCDFPNEWHGENGPIPVCRAARENWLAPSQAFYEACTELGYSYCPDMNRPDARGVGPIPTNYFQGIRHSSAVGYLIPCRPRPNLEVLAETLVTATVWDTFEPAGLDRLTGLPWQLEVRTTVGQADDGWLTMIMRAPWSAAERGSTIRDADAGRGFTIPSSLMYARSTGELRLRSAKPTLAPVLDFNYLSNAADLDNLRNLARLALEIGHHPAFDAIRVGLRQPAPDDLDSNASFDDWIARTITTGHHISCTCRMGPASDPSAVVDQQGRVYGLDNLRVIDASIMPDCPSVNLNATVIMMAEKLADTYSKSPTASSTKSSRSIPV